MGQVCSGRPATADETFVVMETGFSIPVRTTRKMGWKRDLPDFRDKVLSWPEERSTNVDELALNGRSPPLGALPHLRPGTLE